MKKLFSSILILSLVMFVFPVSVGAATDWDVGGTYVWDVFGTYFHDITIDVQNPDGTFSGTAGYPSGGAPWDQAGETTETVVGLVTDNTITFTVTYLGPYAPGSVFNMTGTIDPSGHISGTSPWNWQFTGGVAVDNDSDNDGVLNDVDVCEETTADSAWTEGLGPNRWEVRDNGGVLTWYQNKVKKGTPTPTAGETIAYTYGCNGHQIIEMLDGVMNGHLKFGLSSSVLEDFHKDLADGVLDGLYFVEKVIVPANDVDGVSSVASLAFGHDYVFKASGTALAGDGIEFDADYSYRTPTSVTWTDAVSTYEYLGDTLLDLMVNGGSVNWGAYNALHTYEYEMAGTGASVVFQIYDVYYPNNTGNLVVDVYAKI